MHRITKCPMLYQLCFVVCSQLLRWGERLKSIQYVLVMLLPVAPSRKGSGICKLLVNDMTLLAVCFDSQRF